jgi:hypothetical protein
MKILDALALSRNVDSSFTTKKKKEEEREAV